MENEKENQKPEEESQIPKLSEMVDRLEKANAEAKIILARQEELAARKLLGGESSLAAPEAPKEESPKEYIKRIMGGK